jgi:hypothetical protein
VPIPYWQGLLQDEVVSMWGAGDFAFKHGLIRGRVLKHDAKRDGLFLLIQPHEKYCAFDGGEERVRPHPGYCYLRVGDKMVQALQMPLQESQLRKLTPALVHAP